MTEGRTYTTKEIAKRAIVEPVTIRKYAQKLEEKGYVFEKDEKGWRRFTESDKRALIHLATLRKEGISLEESIERVASLYHYELSVLLDDTTLQGEPSLQEFIKTQIEFNQKVLERLDQQEQRQADRDKKLMFAINQSIETQKLLATIKQKKWWAFWKR